jgi:alpha-amylase
VSYQLTSRRGDRAAFAAMVRTCHAAGVKIYVDAVVNHMAGGASTGAGSAGSGYSQYAYPAVPWQRRLPPLRTQRQRRHRQLGRPVGGAEL